MKHLIIILALIAIARTGQSQQYVYQKLKINKVVYSCLIHDQDTIKIPVQIKSRYSEPRIVHMGSTAFIFSYDERTKEDRFLDGHGNLLATTKSFYDMTTVQGNLFDHSKTGRNEWKYQSDGKEIVNGKYIKGEKVKIIELTWSDAISSEKELLRVMALAYGVEMIRAKAAKPLYYIIHITLGLMAAIVTSDQTPSVN